MKNLSRFSVTSPWDDNAYKGYHSGRWLSFNKEQFSMRIWKINVEQESFEIDQQLQLPAIQFRRIYEETNGDISRMTVKWWSKGTILDHIVLETHGGTRLFSLCSTGQCPTKSG